MAVGSEVVVVGVVDVVDVVELVEVLLGQTVRSSAQFSSSESGVPGAKVLPFPPISHGELIHTKSKGYSHCATVGSFRRPISGCQKRLGKLPVGADAGGVGNGIVGAVAVVDPLINTIQISLIQLCRLCIGSAKVKPHIRRWLEPVDSKTKKT